MASRCGRIVSWQVPMKQLHDTWCATASALIHCGRPERRTNTAFPRRRNNAPRAARTRWGARYVLAATKPRPARNNPSAGFPAPVSIIMVQTLQPSIVGQKRSRLIRCCRQMPASGHSKIRQPGVNFHPRKSRQSGRVQWCAATNSP